MLYPILRRQKRTKSNRYGVLVKHHSAFLSKTLQTWALIAHQHATWSYITSIDGIFSLDIPPIQDGSCSKNISTFRPMQSWKKRATKGICRTLRHRINPTDLHQVDTYWQITLWKNFGISFKQTCSRMLEIWLSNLWRKYLKNYSKNRACLLVHLLHISGA